MLSFFGHPVYAVYILFNIRVNIHQIRTVNDLVGYRNRLLAIVGTQGTI